MKKITLWQLLIALFLIVSINTMGQEIMLNGNVEDWDDATHPTNWTKVENIDQESVTANVHGGTYSAKHTGGTKDLGQYIGGIIPGDSYTISIWYKVVANDGTDARIWSYWRSGGSNISDNAAELRGPNGSYFDNNGGVWTEYTTTITAPATADELYFEVRTYSGAVTYWDDMSVFHNSSTTVAAPSFDPGTGTYFNPVSVSMSTTTSGATIYYTTDGNDPDNTSTVYTTPVDVTATTTLKAFAELAGETDSPITTGVYTFVVPTPIADMATLRTQAGGAEIYQLNSEVLLTYQQGYRHQKYIQDGTAGILIDDNDGKLATSYAIGDGITGIIGKLGSYNGMLQFIPQVDAGAATSTGNAIVPVLITATEFVNNFENYEGQVVRIKNLTFGDAGDTFYNGNVYSLTDPNMNPLDFRTTFYGVDYIGTTIPSMPQDIVGIANERNNYYLTARNDADMRDAPPGVPLGSTGIIIAVLLITAVLVIRRGKLI